MTVTPEHQAGALVLRAEGELDVSVVPALLPQVAELVQGVSGVVLDLTLATFFDSSGVRLVDRLARVCAQQQVGVRVVAPPHTPARRVLEIVGMAGALVSDDVSTALAAVAPAGPPTSGR